MDVKEVVLYVSKPYKKYRWIGYMSTIQIGFVLASLISMPTKRMMNQRQIAINNSGKKEEEEYAQVPPEQDQQSQAEIPVTDRTENIERTSLMQRLQHLNYVHLFSLQNLKENVLERPYFTLGILGSSSLISFALLMYARRMAHIITLLPGERIRFEPFSAFALRRPQCIELPARNISCVIGRKSDKNYSILKFKGYLGYHLVHKSEGSFLEPKLYDQHLGYARSWHKK